MVANASESFLELKANFKLDIISVESCMLKLIGKVSAKRKSMLRLLKAMFQIDWKSYVSA